MRQSRVEFDSGSLAAAHQLIGPSTARKKLVFFAPRTGKATVSNDPITTAGQGWVLAAGQGMIVLDEETWGDIVQRPWFVMYDPAQADPIAWIQVLA